MNERQLISEIGHVARRSGSLDAAVAGIEGLLAGEIGAARLILRPRGSGSPVFAGAVSQFLDSREYPFRGMYTAPLVRDGHLCGTLVACFGTWGAPAELLRRATARAAATLGPLFPGRRTVQETA